MKMSIGIKLLILFGAITALFIGFAVYSGSDLNRFSAYTDQFRDVHKKTKIARELQINIANVRQFMTDASLTRDGKVISDKALPNLNEAKEKIKDLIDLNEGQTEIINLLKEIEGNLPEMWNAGNRMFEAYLNDRDRGNGVMDDYDSISTKLIKELDRYVQVISEEEDTISAGISNKIKSSIKFFAVIIIISLIIAGVVAFFIRSLHHSIVKPVHALKAAVTRIKEGDLTVEVNTQIGNEEMRELAIGFNEMVREIKGIVYEVREGAMQLGSSSEALEEVGKMIIDGYKNQDMKSAQVAAAAHELSATFTDVAGSSSSAAESAKDASIVAGSGETIMENSMQSINGVAATTKETSELISVLGKRSQDVGKIIKVIDDIAHQTNLLALNAAIEAARAGEQGRGFAVVADEVRQLAEKTTGATKEITNVIKAIQTDTDKALQSMQRELVSVDEGVNFAREAGSALKEIVGKVDHVTSMMQQIAAANTEQSAAVDQMSGDIEYIAGISRETIVYSEQITYATDVIKKLSKQLQSTVGKFKFTES